MAVTIDPTAGGISANSLVTEAQAIAFANTRLNLTGWTTIAGDTCTDNERRALIEATRQLSALVYRGVKATQEQALAWPRLLAPDPDAGAVYMIYFDASIIPQRIADATCELAIAFLAAGPTDIVAHDDTLDVVRDVTGPLETEYAQPSQRAQGLSRFPRVLRQIAPLLGVSAGQVRLTR